MVRGWAALLALGLLGTAQAGPSIRASTPSTLTLAITQPASIPLQLSAGPQGSTTISVNQTGAASTILKSNTWNTTRIANVDATDYRIRLTMQNVTNIASCSNCTLQLRVAGQSNSVQVVVNNGAVLQSQGSFVIINGTGGAIRNWYIWGVFAQSNKNDPTATLGYQIDIVPVGSLSPGVSYFNMTMKFDPA